MKTFHPDTWLGRYVLASQEVRECRGKNPKLMTAGDLAVYLAAQIELKALMAEAVEQSILRLSRVKRAAK